MARVTLDIEIEDFLYDLDEAHTEMSFLAYQHLMPELARIGEVKSCRVLVSEETDILNNTEEGRY